MDGVPDAPGKPNATAKVERKSSRATPSEMFAEMRPQSEEKYWNRDYLRTGKGVGTWLLGYRILLSNTILNANAQEKPWANNVSGIFFP